VLDLLGKREALVEVRVVPELLVRDTAEQLVQLDQLELLVLPHILLLEHHRHLAHTETVGGVLLYQGQRGVLHQQVHSVRHRDLICDIFYITASS
jgi:hypothetical protein